MRIELDEDDLKNIEYVNSGDFPEYPLFVSKVGKYYINFTCVDVGKANNFVAFLFTHANKNDGFLENTLGIKFNSLNLCHGDQKVAELKSMLQDMINKLDNL